MRRRRTRDPSARPRSATATPRPAVAAVERSDVPFRIKGVRTVFAQSRAIRTPASISAATHPRRANTIMTARSSPHRARTTRRRRSRCSAECAASRSVGQVIAQEENRLSRPGRLRRRVSFVHMHQAVRACCNSTSEQIPTASGFAHKRRRDCEPLPACSARKGATTRQRSSRLGAAPCGQPGPRAQSGRTVPLPRTRRSLGRSDPGEADFCHSQRNRAAPRAAARTFVRR
jgi:hypothetical protein